MVSRLINVLETVIAFQVDQAEIALLPKDFICLSMRAFDTFHLIDCRIYNFECRLVNFLTQMQQRTILCFWKPIFISLGVIFIYKWVSFLFGTPCIAFDEEYL